MRARSHQPPGRGPLVAHAARGSTTSKLLMLGRCRQYGDPRLLEVTEESNGPSGLRDDDDDDDSLAPHSDSLSTHSIFDFWCFINYLVTSLLTCELRPTPVRTAHCVSLRLCTIVVHSTALNSSDNLHSYPPDNHHSSDKDRDVPCDSELDGVAVHHCEQSASETPYAVLQLSHARMSSSALPTTTSCHTPPSALPPQYCKTHRHTHVETLHQMTKQEAKCTKMLQS